MAESQDQELLFRNKIDRVRENLDLLKGKVENEMKYNAKESNTFTEENEKKISQIENKLTDLLDFDVMNFKVDKV